MALTEHYYTEFVEGGYYHVYNRVVDRKLLFTQKRNYYYFLTKLKKYLIPFVDIYAFCLLDNHFHILLKVKVLQKDLTTLKELSNLGGHFDVKPELNSKVFPLLNQEENPRNRTHYLVSHAFQRMFQSYAMAFNKQENRIGTLFQTPFKRSEVGTEEYLAQLVYYIHTNPQKHKISDNFKTYPHSSYKLYKYKELGELGQEDLYDFFGGYKEFMDFHNQMHEEPKIKHIIENE